MLLSELQTLRPGESQPAMATQYYIRDLPNADIRVLHSSYTLVTWGDNPQLHLICARCERVTSYADFVRARQCVSCDVQASPNAPSIRDEGRGDTCEVRDPKTPADHLPLLVAIAEHFEFAEFPDDSEVHSVGHREGPYVSYIVRERSTASR